MKDKPSIHNPNGEPLQAFLTDTLQLGDVLEQLLHFAGPSRLVVSTFSTGEEFVRRLLRLRREGLITQASVYLDMKAAEKTARTNPILRSAFDAVHLTRNHSKVLLIAGEQQRIVVLTSQNQTRGNRIESYCIMHNDALYLHFSDFFKNLQTYQPWT